MAFSGRQRGCRWRLKCSGFRKCRNEIKRKILVPGEIIDRRVSVNINAPLARKAKRVQSITLTICNKVVWKRSEKTLI